MWQQGWREELWSQLDQPWDLIIVGGGITGAGILREATRSGYKTLLVEAHDFASGTSSRSSKLVHGGLRYLKNLQVKTTLESVAERDRLIRQGRGLVSRMKILFASYESDKTPAWMMGLGLVIYGLMARKWQYGHYDAGKLKQRYPLLGNDGLLGGFPYFDAQADDARLTLRVIQEAVRDGGTALNYARAGDLLRQRDGRVCGIVLHDQAPESRRSAEVRARLVINAAGAWADELRGCLGRAPRLRPLRGSHLTFPRQRLPLNTAVSLNHPRDGRPVFIFPWEGVVLVGTTDMDIDDGLTQDPAISQVEAEYLLEVVRFAFPGQELSFADVRSTWSGIRPVVDTGKSDPSKESREHVIWLEDGLLTVSGGKLTTFRVMARDALRAARRQLPEKHIFYPNMPVLDPIEVECALAESSLPKEAALRLAGRYGCCCHEILAASCPGELDAIADTPYRWAELRWAAKSEGVVHLDDLLLRRVRLGLLLPEGGAAEMNRIRSIVQPELGWTNGRWVQEERTYRELWKRAYSLG